MTVRPRTGPDGNPEKTLNDEEARVPVVSTNEIVDRACTERYGVGASNILDDLTIDAVLAAAEAERAPVILQTSVTTVRAYGRDRLLAEFRAMAKDARCR
ncbi:class II fructose-bisphosphate aldolase [Nakamurella sp.]|uniref:class II fructose-bisphosphate aldolase n=1 Tax=Nakamurella sp. TaxID=1869182 RepID=UPI0037835F1C